MPKAHRPLRFETIDDLLREIERLELANREGRIVCHGNWSAGQILGHVASWIHYAYDGYPIKPLPRWLQRLIGLRKGTFLHKGLPRGGRIPGVPGGTVGIDPLDTEEGIRRLRLALARLAIDQPAHHPHPALGSLGYDDRVRLNLRHAELHLGFISYEPNE